MGTVDGQKGGSENDFGEDRFPIYPEDMPAIDEIVNLVRDAGYSTYMSGSGSVGRAGSVGGGSVGARPFTTNHARSRRDAYDFYARVSGREIRLGRPNDNR